MLYKYIKSLNILYISHMKSLTIAKNLRSMRTIHSELLDRVRNYPHKERKNPEYAALTVDAAIMSDQISKLEHLCESEFYVNEFPDTFCSMHPTNKTDWDSIYLDQAPEYSRIYHISIHSMYTPHGIKQIESAFIAAITLPEAYDYTPGELDKMIKHNPHLHNIIKTNLLENLHRR